MIRKKYRGTLYQGELVTFENKEVEGHWRVKDSMGRIWILDKKVLSKSPTQLSRS